MNQPHSSGTAGDVRGSTGNPAWSGPRPRDLQAKETAKSSPVRQRLLLLLMIALIYAGLFASALCIGTVVRVFTLIFGR